MAMREETGHFQLVLTTPFQASDVKHGESIAVNGCCLTVSQTEAHENGLCCTFDLLQETLHRTNLGDLMQHSRVNLERAVRPTDRMGGHFVTGHIDTAARILSFAPMGGDYRLEIETPISLQKFLVEKGCIAVDGISLTVAETGKDRFAIWIIPHTLEVTNLKDRKKGDRLNLEADLLAKYAEKILSEERG